MDIRKIIREELERIISEERYELAPYYDDVDLSDYGLDEYEASNEANEIAKDGGVTILRDKELNSILIDTEYPRVIGGLWVSSESDKFSFDIAIDSSYQNMGLSSKLIITAIDEYKQQKDIYGDDFKMEVDVINPKLAKILQNKYGFHIVVNLSQDRVLMSLNDSIDEIDISVGHTQGVKPGQVRKFPAEDEGGHSLNLSVSDGPHKFPKEEDIT